MTDDDVDVDGQRFCGRPQHRQRVLVERRVDLAYQRRVVSGRQRLVAVLGHLEADQLHRVVEVLLLGVRVLDVAQHVPVHHRAATHPRTIVEIRPR